MLNHPNQEYLEFRAKLSALDDVRKHIQRKAMPVLLQHRHADLPSSKTLKKEDAEKVLSEFRQSQSTLSHSLSTMTTTAVIEWIAADIPNAPLNMRQALFERLKEVIQRKGLPVGSATAHIDSCVFRYPWNSRGDGSNLLDFEIHLRLAAGFQRASISMVTPIKWSRNLLRKTPNMN